MEAEISKRYLIINMKEISLKKLKKMILNIKIKRIKEEQLILNNIKKQLVVRKEWKTIKENLKLSVKILKINSCKTPIQIKIDSSCILKLM